MRSALGFGGLLSVVVLGGGLALAGCDGATGPDDRDLTSPEEAEAMASFLSGVDVLSVGMATLDVSSGTRTFNRTAPCPAGGTVAVSGSNESSLDTATRVVSTRWTTTQTHTACAITHTRGDQKVTAVMDGSVTAAGSSSYQLPEKKGEMRTLLSWASTRVGSTKTTVGDKVRSCEMNVSESYDPATRSFTIKGTVCGRQVDITRGLGKAGG
jgi:hypothetical protein